jgi:hypothetical protein
VIRVPDRIRAVQREQAKFGQMNGAELVSERLRPAADLIAEGRALARQWRAGSNCFLRTAEVGSEAEYKRRCVGRLMQSPICFSRAVGAASRKVCIGVLP